MSNVNAIEISNLSKTYPRTTQTALSDLSLTVERGEIFGYLGPNGAGKSTTIRIMLDLIRPTSGKVLLMGRDAQRESVHVKHFIGNLPGEIRLWEHLNGRQILHYLAGLRPNVDLNDAYQMAERLQLNLSLKAGNYSTGNKRKLGIVQAMMHHPPLLILDEPTTGLDPLVRQTFHEMLMEARDAGATVFLSSHVLSEVQAICDRVAILRAGTLQTVQSIEALSHARSHIVTIYTRDALLAERWERIDGVKEVNITSGCLRLHVMGAIDAVIKQAATITIDDMTIEEPRLETLFMTYYGDKQA
ncbi:MAG: ABC transporter ATP-binding protein [Aggregatilineales bacterium]